MDETKLKEAFSRIKKDMNFIKGEIDGIKKAATLNSDIKKQVKEIKDFNLDKFTVNMQKELENLNKLITEFNKRFKESDEEVKKFSKQIAKYYEELAAVKHKLSHTSNETANTELDVKLLNERFVEFEELINEKVSLENASTKLELQDEIANLKESAYTSKEDNKSISKEVLENHLMELNEIINERISMEIGSMRMEFTEEIGKLYDRFYNEILDIKTGMGIKPEKSPRTPAGKSKNEKSTMSKNTSGKKNEVKTNKKENPSKIKKAINWLFVDEDEEIDSIKSEVKKASDK